MRHVVNVSCVYRVSVCGVCVVWCVCVGGVLASLGLWVPDVLSFIIAKNIHEQIHSRIHTQSNHCRYH